MFTRRVALSLSSGVILAGLLFTGSASALEAQSSKSELNAKTKASIEDLKRLTPGAAELLSKARGVLVFPSVVKVGVGIGGEYGEGALWSDGKVVDYYATASGSIGFQLGAQSRSQAILFMTDDALEKFKKSEGWKVGVDGSVALATLGAGGSLDSETLKKPVIGFIYSGKGLMYNLTFEGSKIGKVSARD